MDDPTTVFAQSAVVLVAALIGFLGALIVNRRTLAHAREQRRIERTQEMQAEVIPRLFVLLQHVEDQAAWALDLPGRATEQMREPMREYAEGHLTEEQAEALEKEALAILEGGSDAFESRMEEFKGYFILHRIWLPERLGVAFEGVLDGYDAHMPTLVRTVRVWAAREERFSEADRKDMKTLDAFLNQDMAFYEAHVRAMRAWFEGERLRREAAMWSDAQKILGVEDSEDAHE